MLYQCHCSIANKYSERLQVVLGFIDSIDAITDLVIIDSGKTNDIKTILKSLNDDGYLDSNVNLHEDDISIHTPDKAVSRIKNIYVRSQLDEVTLRFIKDIEPHVFAIFI